MMGGVAFNADCTTAMPRLYAAGEDTGGVHGANRLGGNGVANSTVFGGIAGDAMGARDAKRAGALPEPDQAAIDAAHERAFAPLGRRGRRSAKRCASGSTTSCGTTSASCAAPTSLARGTRRARCAAARHRRLRRRRRRAAATISPGWTGSTWKISTLVSRAIARRRRLPPRQPRRAFPRGLSADVRARHLALHLGAPRRRPIAVDSAAGRVHPRAAGRKPAPRGGRIGGLTGRPDIRQVCYTIHPRHGRARPGHPDQEGTAVPRESRSPG